MDKQPGPYKPPQPPPAPRKGRKHNVELPKGAHPDVMPTHESCPSCRDNYGFICTGESIYASGSAPETNIYIPPVRRKLVFCDEIGDEPL